MNEDNFFKTYSARSKKTEEGIPGLIMNSPVMNKNREGKIGLELEVEGTRLGHVTEGLLEKYKGEITKARWSVHEDGSLRNGGREFVLTVPCNEKELKPLLEGLFEGVKEAKATIENTNRCSTHVHINIGGKKINEITSAIALWYMFEDALISWCGEERKSNHFCLALSDVSSTLNAWQTYLRTGNRPGGEGLKYSALNVLPIWRFGSLEFRCGAASHEPLMPLKWASFLSAMVDYASEKFANPKFLANAASEYGPSCIFEEICDRAEMGDVFRKEVYALNDDFDGKCLRGLRNAQSIILGFPWDDWMKEIDKAYVPNPFGKDTKKLKINRVDRADPWNDHAGQPVQPDNVAPALQAGGIWAVNPPRQARGANLVMPLQGHRRQRVASLIERGHTTDEAIRLEAREHNDAELERIGRMFAANPAGEA